MLRLGRSYIFLLRLIRNHSPKSLSLCTFEPSIPHKNIACHFKYKPGRTSRIRPQNQLVRVTRVYYIAAASHRKSPTAKGRYRTRKNILSCARHAGPKRGRFGMYRAITIAERHYRAAIRAVSRFIFEPALQGVMPVPTTMVVPLTFYLR